MLDRVGRLAVFVLVFLVCGLAVRVLFVDPRRPDEVELQAAPGPIVPAPPRELPPQDAAPAPGADIDPLFVPRQPRVIDGDPDLDQVQAPPECEHPAPEPTSPDPGGSRPHGSN